MTGPAHRALLRACLADDADLGDRLLEWQALVDLDDVDGPTFALLPFLHVRLARTGITARDSGRIKGIYARAWYVQQHAPEHSVIDGGAVVLRGVGVRALAYGGQWVRSGADTLVVGPGWTLADASTDSEVLVRARRSARPVAGEAFSTPAPAYHLLDALLRGSGWVPDPSLVPLLDAGLLARQLDDAAWALVAAEVGRCGWRPFVEPRLRLLAELGAPVPTPVIESITSGPPGLGARMVTVGARGPAWQRRALRGAYGLYLADPGRATGARVVIDYPVRNARLVAASVRRRRS